MTIDVPRGTRILPFLVLAILWAGSPATSLTGTVISAARSGPSPAPSAPPAGAKEGTAQTPPQTGAIALSGILLLFERPIQPADVIEVGPLSGEVKRIGIRSTTMRTGERANVIIPNANLISREVINWTLSDRKRRVDVAATVAYGSDPNQVMTILLKLVRNYPDVLATPEPVVVFQGMGETSLGFSLRFWTANFDNWVNLRTEVTAEVYRALNEAGIAFPTGTAPAPRQPGGQTSDGGR